MIDEKKIEEAADAYSLIKSTPNGVSDYDINLRKGFVDGINWFKNNLWHDANEEPRHGLVLIEFHEDMAHQFAIYQSKEYINLIFVKRWLYIEDLLKGGK